MPIKAELGLSDSQLGLMGGVAFALFYSTLAVPIARLADRKSRIAIISTSVAVWSLFTAACGFAQNFWQLFLARVGVGIGEAGGVAPSYSLIADYFPVGARARALAFFSLGIPIGSALGIYFGGWIASSVNWRTAFIVVGLAGLPAALLLKLFVPEPKRGATDAHLSDDAPPFKDVVSRLARTPSFWLLSFGAASGSILGYGLIFWLPSFFARSFGLSLNEIGWYYGSIVLVGGVLGTVLGGVIADRSGADRPGVYALIPALAFLLAAPAFAFGLFANSLALSWLFFTVGQMLALAWLGPVITAIQHIVPPSMRATASASFLLINNLIGIGFGIFFLGFMSDRMTAAHGNDSLQYSILYGLGFYVLSSLLYLLASRWLARDWYRA